ncbi:MAG: hypothetical protein PHN75_12515 [Syntrophales bacterium]|nr:hypothetical protein [Syntrophales bacterium]
MSKRNQKNKKSTSPDYPLYEKMKKKAPKAAAYWITGDRLYHLGLSLIIICIPLIFLFYTHWAASGYLPWTVAALMASLLLFVLGLYCKRESYKLAIKAGIDITKL